MQNKMMMMRRHCLPTVVDGSYMGFFSVHRLIVKNQKKPHDLFILVVHAVVFILFTSG